MNVPLRICWRSIRQQLPSICRRGLAQAAAQRASNGPPGLFTVPQLNDDEYIRTNGIVDENNPRRILYSTLSVDQAWYTYQQRMLDGVNGKIAERGIEGDVKDILIQTARNPAQASLFNHASMAFNNHAYFSGINPRGPVSMPESLQRALITDFGSVDNLRAEMLAMAETMFGPGFVWLVRAKASGVGGKPKFMLLPTYLAGSPLSGAHNRRQPVDMNTQNVADAQKAGGVAALSKAQFLAHNVPQNSVGQFGPYAAKNNALAFGGVDVLPCLCVNTWEHAYIFDWRFSKRSFLERWWEFVNWNVVTQLADVENDISTRYYSK